MKLTSVILLSMAAFGQSFKYYSSGATEDVQAGIAGVTLNADQIAVLDSEGAWVASSCDTGDLEAALKLDTMGSGGVEKGSCCINGHHAACQEIQRQIRERCTVKKQGTCGVVYTKSEGHVCSGDNHADTASNAASTVADSDACAAKCDAESDCNGFSFHTSNGGCYLTKDCSDPNINTSYDAYAK